MIQSIKECMNEMKKGIGVYIEFTQFNRIIRMGYFEITSMNEKHFVGTVHINIPKY
jgi:hypothetical protein